MTVYRQTRNYENLQKAMYDGVGPYGIPQIQPTQLTADNWISFNYAKGCDEPEIHGVHFFVDDYQFFEIVDESGCVSWYAWTLSGSMHTGLLYIYGFPKGSTDI